MSVFAVIPVETITYLSLFMSVSAVI
jgi:hypothetical protein